MPLYILIVDDININRFLAQTILNDFGFKSDVADNGKIAIELLEKNKYDLIINCDANNVLSKKFFTKKI